MGRPLKYAHYNFFFLNNRSYSTNVNDQIRIYQSNIPHCLPLGSHMRSHEYHSKKALMASRQNIRALGRFATPVQPRKDSACRPPEDIIPVSESIMTGLASSFALKAF